MNMLNGIQGIHVYGENNGFLKYMLAYLQANTTHRQTMENDSEKWKWCRKRRKTHNYGGPIFNISDLGKRPLLAHNGPFCSEWRVDRLHKKLRTMEPIQGIIGAEHQLRLQSALWEYFDADLFSTMEPLDPTCRTYALGFKEISVRWNEHVLRFLEQIAPCSKFIFNWRDVPTLSLLQTPQAMVHLRNQLEIALNKTVNHSKVFLLPLGKDGFTLAQFNALAKWLGRTCTFQNILHSNLGNYDPGATEMSSCV